MLNKCESCAIMASVRENNAKQHHDPACCARLMNNVICGDKTVDDCTEYEHAEKGDNHQ